MSKIKTNYKFFSTIFVYPSDAENFPLFSLEISIFFIYLHIQNSFNIIDNGRIREKSRLVFVGRKAWTLGTYIRYKQQIKMQKCVWITATETRNLTNENEHFWDNESRAKIVMEI